jgi:ubiquinone/menaquinone biosynthesis C-methylase UbiE
MKKVQPYTKLAQIYDKIMDHVDYRRWSNYLKSLFKYSDIEVQQVLDLSFGTGNILPHIHANNLRLIGSDLSRDMIQQYKAKEKVNLIPLFVNDARNIAVNDCTFDVVLFLYDSINYIKEKSDLDQLLGEIKRILRLGGIFIFDTITDYHCKIYYNNSHESEFWNGAGYYRHGYYDAEIKIQTTQFEIILGDESYLEIHKQYIYSIEDLINVLLQHEFQISGLFQNFTFTKSKSDAERVHFVCKKS